MSDFKLTTIDEFDAATERLLETGRKVGADSWQMRVKIRPPTANSGSRAFAAASAPWDPAVLPPKPPEESAAVMPTASPAEISCALWPAEQPPIPIMAGKSATL